ncbi:unnamed protein product [Ambrosiozyma monospora]|uniref:Unnamed protein product n=1 Tax=Ambrosiozyma monospora TaxID=43982 RepID=A0ACB5TN26_AMBMO|nr:unnamed protein product [Ambrosiozyma monospora]
MFNNKKASFSKYYSTIDYKEDVAFESHYYTDVFKIYKKLNSKIGSISEQSASKPLFVIQSPISEKLSQILRASSNLPNLKMKVNEIQMNALSWHSLLIKRIMNHYLSLAGWITKMIALSKYANIPLCNLKVDNIAYLIDIEYARKLIESNIVLWWSPSTNPDYGGAEKDKMTLKFDNQHHFNINFDQ